MTDAPKSKDGFVPTLNKYGYMLSSLDDYTRAFVEFAGGCAYPVVDIGAAYGVATLPALERGARVVAVDLEARHLEILREKASAEFRDNLITIAAAFPEALELEGNSIGAFLVSRVAHFLSPERLELAARKLHGWLVPHGKLFLTAETPYIGVWEKFIAVYEERQAQGEKWPGLVTDVPRYCPARAANLPPLMHFLDPDVLTRVFTGAGFTIEKCDFLARPEFPADLRRDGRESVGLIAVKPA